MELKKQDVGVWVKQSKELPEIKGWYLLQANGAYPKAVGKVYFDGTNFKLEQKDFMIAHLIEWLKPIEQVYVLTEMGIIKMIGDAFDAGAVYEYEKHFGAIPPLTENKEQFIESITK